MSVAALRVRRHAVPANQSLGGLRFFGFKGLGHLGPKRPGTTLQQNHRSNEARKQLPGLGWHLRV